MDSIDYSLIIVIIHFRDIGFIFFQIQWVESAGLDI